MVPVDINWIRKGESAAIVDQWPDASLEDALGRSLGELTALESPDIT